MTTHAAHCVYTSGTPLKSLYRPPPPKPPPIRLLLLYSCIPTHSDKRMCSKRLLRPLLFPRSPKGRHACTPRWICTHEFEPELVVIIMSHGDCRAAAEVLAVADAQLPHSNSPALQAARLGLAHGRALHRGNARHAALFASQLLGLADPTDSVCKTLRCGTLMACITWSLNI